jgi:hypothetical protein
MGSNALTYLMSDFEMREMREPMYSDILTRLLTAMCGEARGGGKNKRG